MKMLLAPINLPISERAGATAASGQPIVIPTDGPNLTGELTIPTAATGLVIFAHGAGNPVESAGNIRLARALNEAGFATLLFELLTGREQAKDEASGYWRFEIELLTHRLVHATRWAQAQPATRDLAIGYLGTGTAAACALRVAV